MIWKRALISGATGVALVGLSFAAPPSAHAAGTHSTPKGHVGLAPQPKRASTHVASTAPKRAVGRTFTPRVASTVVSHTYVVNDTADVAGDGAGSVCETVVGNGRCTLRAAVQASNVDNTLDRIIIPAGSYNLQIPTATGSDYDSNTGSLKLMDLGGVIIQGAGAGSTFIDGAGTSNPGTAGDRVFTVPNSSSSPAFPGTVNTWISGVTVFGANGGADGVTGAGIYNGDNGFMVLNGVEVANNSTGTASGRSGGGIYDNNAIQLTNTNIHDNTATGSGGGVDDSSSYTLIGSNDRITGNTAGSSGGGLYATYGVGANGWVVSGNKTTGSDGGGLYIDDASTVANSTISGNTSASYGGGIYLSNSYPLTLSNSLINDNQAGSEGAGLYVGSDASVTASNDTFSANGNPQGNTSGGAIYNNGSTAVTGGTFSGNYASYGAAVYNSYGFHATGAMFTQNTARYDGGAVYSGDNGTVLDADTFTANTAEYGGAVYNNNGVTITNSVLSGNSALYPTSLSSAEGGAVYSDDVTNFAGDTFTGNSSDGDGGAIYQESGYPGSWSHLLVGGNHAGYSGGGLYNSGAYINDSYSTWYNNVSGDWGGAWYNDGDMTANWDGFTGNTDTGANACGPTCSGAGGIYTDSVLHLDNSLVAQNHELQGDGGGIYNDDYAYLTNDTVAYNDASHYGGGILQDYTVLQLVNVTLHNNLASTDGGGLFTIAGEGPVVFRDTIASVNSPDNCSIGSTTLTSAGYNLSTDTSCPLHAAGDLAEGTSANLGPLAWNGGPTLTVLPNPGSVAIDNGGQSCPQTDQRGLSRPQGPACDIGAVEALASSASVDHFLNRLYNDVLGRGVDAAGLAGYGSALAHGTTTPRAVASALLNSQEFRYDVAQSLYAQYLHRGGSVSDAAGWAGYINGGATLESTRSLFIGGQDPSTYEYWLNAGSNTSTFVTDVYNQILNRDPSPTELTNATTNLGASPSAATRVYYAYDLLTSNEGRVVAVNNWYEQFLRRTADAGGLSGSVAALNSGARDESVEAFLLGSPEYWAYAQTN